MKVTGYDFTRNWFDWAFENPEKINPNDTALYLWLIEKNNRCGWVDKFSITASESMAACGFKTYPPYKKAFDNLVNYGFIEIVRKSANQYQCNIIALSKNDKATNKALDKASLKQSSKHLYSNRESTFDINKQVNKETIKPLNNETKDSAAKKNAAPEFKYPEDLIECKNIYNDFIKKLTGGAGAKIDGKGINALKSIIIYLKSQIKEPDAKVSTALQVVFDKWNVLDPFIQNQTSLSQINSNLQNIIIQIKNNGKLTSNKPETIGRTSVDSLREFAARYNLPQHE